MTDTGPNGNGRNGNGRDSKGRFLKGVQNGTPFKPGQAPIKRTRKPTFMDHMRTALGDTITRADGREIPKDQAIAEMLVNRTIKCLSARDKRGNPVEWDRGTDALLNRISPIPRSAVLIQERDTVAIAEVNEDGVRIGFIDKIRTFADTTEPSDRDILDFLDHDIGEHLGSG